MQDRAVNRFRPHAFQGESLKAADLEEKSVLQGKAGAWECLPDGFPDFRARPAAAVLRPKGQWPLFKLGPPAANVAVEPMEMFEGYEPGKFYDEMFAEPGKVRDYCDPLYHRFNGLSERDFLARKATCELYFLRQGITFNVYHDNQGTERIFPFDPVPRVRKRAIVAALRACRHGATDIVLVFEPQVQVEGMEVAQATGRR